MAGIAFADIEARSTVDILSGPYPYAAHPSTRILSLQLILPDGRKGVYAPEEFRGDYDTDLWVKYEWNKHIRDGGVVAFWNANFDRTVLREKAHHAGLWMCPLSQTVCAMSQALNYSLPGKLATAAKAANLKIGKDTRGRALLNKYSDGNKPWPTDLDDLPLLWQYGLRDVEVLQELWNRSRPWSLTEWEDYQVVEAMNDRGLGVDIEFAHAAVKWALLEKADLNRQLRKITKVPGITLAHHKAKAEWIAKQLKGTPFESALQSTKVIVETAEDGTRRRRSVTRNSIDKGAQTAVLDMMEAASAEDLPEAALLRKPRIKRAIQFIDILQKGNSVASKKFGAMLRMQHEGRIYGQFRAMTTQTGRLAGTGVQPQNTPRAKIKPRSKNHKHPALDVIEFLTNTKPSKRGARAAARATKLSFAQVLARCVRPSLIPAEGHILVYGDLKSIEGRSLPYLAKSEDGLAPYIRGECVYSKAAEAIYGVPWKSIYEGYRSDDPDMVYKRLVGKIAELALGYGGGSVALRKMARGMDVKLTVNEAEGIKRAWRASKPWAVAFWKELQHAAFEAIRSGRPVRVGRDITYQLVGRDLWCILPCGRPIVYGEARIERVWKDLFEDYIHTITYRKVYGTGIIRGELYGGLAAENVTQGFAASLLRRSQRELHEGEWPIVASTHDEIMLEVLIDEESEAREALRVAMSRQPKWARGLPLEVDIESGAYYGK